MTRDEKAWISREELEKEMGKKEDLEKKKEKERKDKEEKEREEKKKKEEKEKKESKNKKEKEAREKKEDKEERYLELKEKSEEKSNKKHSKKNGTWKKVFMWIFILLLVAGGSYTGYVFGSNYLTKIKIDEYNRGGSDAIGELTGAVIKHGGVKIDLSENDSIVLTQYKKALGDGVLVEEVENIPEVNESLEE